jgi:hypothetical protein
MAMDAVKQAAGWIAFAAALAPIWGTLLWELWDRVIRPRRIARDRIDALAAAMLAQHGDRAEEIALIKEDRAWRYSESFKQGTWRQVRKRIAAIRRENGPTPPPPASARRRRAIPCID